MTYLFSLYQHHPNNHLKSQFEFDKYWRNYIEGKDASLVPQLNLLRLPDYLLLAVALGDIKKAVSLKDFFFSSYTGYLQKERFLSPRFGVGDIEESISFLDKNGIIKINTAGEIVLLILIRFQVETNYPWLRC